MFPAVNTGTHTEASTTERAAKCSVIIISAHVGDLSYAGVRRCSCSFILKKLRGMLWRLWLWPHWS